MLNITNIPSPRVEIVDPSTGLISREWYRFFLNLFTLTGEGSNTASLQDLQLGPDVTSYTSEQDTKNKNLYYEVNTQPKPELGTMAAVQQDNVRFLGFSVVPSPSVVGSPGYLWWNATGTLNIKMGNNNITQQVGEEIYVYGEAKEAILPGQVIARSSGTAEDPSGEKTVRFEPAPIGTSDAELILGVATESIAKNSFGRITAFGVVHDLSTSGLGDGSALWYDPTVLGGYTVTKPVAPNMKFHIGNVVKAAGGGNGSIFVDMTPGSVLGGTDSNVQITSVANNDLLQYY